MHVQDYANLALGSLEELLFKFKPSTFGLAFALICFRVLPNFSLVFIRLRKHGKHLSFLNQIRPNYYRGLRALVPSEFKDLPVLFLMYHVHRPFIGPISGARLLPTMRTILHIFKTQLWKTSSLKLTFKRWNSITNLGTKIQVACMSLFCVMRI